MSKDLSRIDPLVIYRCKNRQCRQTFTPSTIMNVEELKVFFECPICGSQYEAQYSLMSEFPDQEVIMLLERPRLVYTGTRIASS
ncbi:MAG: hypothetical protein KAQ95_10290 [Candidatus Heimdallarchaeota archaeon]|nr:hypothetical protein [Candidatus Heimdallarchaeota archaeon]